MSSREIAELVDSRHDKVKQSIERLAERGVITLPPLGEYLDVLGRPAKHYLVGKRDSYVVVAQLSPEFTARLVDRWQELEARQAAPAMDTDEDKLLMIQTLATRQLALLHENKQITLERDHAIKTKAWIGDKKVATAMATASAKSRECARLRALMGEATLSASVLAVQSKVGGANFAWKRLKDYCQDGGLAMGRSFNPGLQLEVNTYPAQAWLAVYGVDLVELFGEVTAA
jgi:phage regulator Rha-like protein